MDWKACAEEVIELLLVLLIALSLLVIALCVLLFWIPLFLIERPWRRKKLHP